MQETCTKMTFATCLAIVLCAAPVYAEDEECFSDDDCPNGSVCYRSGAATQCVKGSDGSACDDTTADAPQPGHCREIVDAQPGVAKGGGNSAPVGDGGADEDSEDSGDDGGCSVLLGHHSAGESALSIFAVSVLALVIRRRALRRSRR